MTLIQLREWLRSVDAGSYLHMRKDEVAELVEDIDSAMKTKARIAALREKGL